MTGKREPLMLAQVWEPAKHDVGGWWASEKLDGERCWWDGGISRGLPASEVPYANVAKDARYVKPPVATGLWTRSGKTVQAPGWFLDQLPVGVNLDGELWMGRGSFQALMTVAKQLVPDDDAWRGVTLNAFDAPAWSAILFDGQLTGANWKGWLHQGMLDWVRRRMHETRSLEDGGIPFDDTPFQGFGLPDECFQRLVEVHHGAQAPKVWRPHPQEKLPRHPDDARARVEELLQQVTAAGGEGLMLRSPSGAWLPKRVGWLLKCKKLSDAEGTVTGFTWGRETDKGSRHLGRMGALILDFNGKRLELSGFTDLERSVREIGSGAPVVTDVHTGASIPLEGMTRDGQDASGAWEPVLFPRGSKVTFTYRELTRDGIPKEARYLRRRDDV